MALSSVLGLGLIIAAVTLPDKHCLQAAKDKETGILAAPHPAPVLPVPCGKPNMPLHPASDLVSPMPVSPHTQQLTLFPHASPSI